MSNRFIREYHLDEQLGALVVGIATVIFVVGVMLMFLVARSC